MRQGDFVTNVEDQSPATCNTSTCVERRFGAPVHQAATLNQALDGVHAAFTRRKSAHIDVGKAGKIGHMKRRLFRDVNLFNKGIQRRRFGVRPDMTCLWQVSGRSNLSFDSWHCLNLEIIDERVRRPRFTYPATDVFGSIAWHRGNIDGPS